MCLYFYQMKHITEYLLLANQPLIFLANQPSRCESEITSSYFEIIVIDLLSDVDENFVFSVWYQALVDAPDMVRCQMNFKRLSLTDIKIDIKRVPKKTTLIKAMEEAGDLLSLDSFFNTYLMSIAHLILS